MDLAESSPITVSSLRWWTASGRSEADDTVVWLRGEHDMDTVAVLSEAMADAIARAADVVVDLRGVEFMDASTLGVIIEARHLLRVRSRSLTVRRPSRCAQRILEVCGLGGLVDPTSVHIAVIAESARALGPWVAVPATDPAKRRAGRPTVVPPGAAVAVRRAP